MMVEPGVRHPVTKTLIRAPAADVGLHGVSLFPTRLRYPDYNRLFVSPVAHSLFYGVVRDFLDALLASGAVKRDHKEAARLGALRERQAASGAQRNGHAMAWTYLKPDLQKTHLCMHACIHACICACFFSLMCMMIFCSSLAMSSQPKHNANFNSFAGSSRSYSRGGISYLPRTS